MFDLGPRCLCPSILSDGDGDSDRAATIDMLLPTSAPSVGNVFLPVQLFRQLPVLSMASVYFLAFEATISPCKDLDVCGYLLHPFNHSHGSNKGMRTCSDIVLLNHT